MIDDIFHADSFCFGFIIPDNSVAEHCMCNGNNIFDIGRILSVDCCMAFSAQDQVLGSSWPCAPGKVVVRFFVSFWSIRACFGNEVHGIIENIIRNGYLQDQFLEEKDLFGADHNPWRL